MHQANVDLRNERPADREAIWHVNRAAFESNAEANLVDALRVGGFIELSLVAEREGQIVGHILFSRQTVRTAARELEALALAPMAVLPSHQRQGIGSKLVRQGIAECRSLGHQIATVLGHPDFYPRFGFSAKLARPLSSPFGDGEAWMALEIVPGALRSISGIVEYAPPFMAMDQPMS